MKYKDITINDPNPIKRFLQKSRFKTALAIFEKYINNMVDGEIKHVLDYGAGNAELTKQLLKKNRHKNMCFHVYEPTPLLMEEAKDNLKSVIDNNAKLVFHNSIESIHSKTIDVLFCLEVFEHLPDDEICNVIGNFKEILCDNGFVVVGVPIEVGIPAFYKGGFRMVRRYGKYDATIKNVLKCIFFHPPKDRPETEITKGFRYYHEHVGFDYRKLMVKFKENFIVVDMCYSPIDMFGSFFNPECYFVCKKG